jgi:hypothetical protein
MNAPSQPARRHTGPVLTRVMVVGGVAIVAFAAGFVPMRTQAHRYASELIDARRDLRRLEIRAHLACAAIQARRGDYEPARQEASKFFTKLRAEVERREESSLSPAERDEASAILNARDDTITVLARSEPVSADRLSNLYVRFRGYYGAETFTANNESPEQASAK